jgi:hypothetical protein
MRTIPAIIMLLACISSYSQTVQRVANETPEAFIQRLKPDSTTLAHPVIETYAWNANSKAIIALYGYDDPADVNTGNNKIVGHVYVPAGKDVFRDITFGPITEEGGYPEIVSVFFANADKDKAKELVVLCKYEQRHYDYSGEMYETFIFDNSGNKNTLTYFHKLSEKFWGCDCGWRNGKTKTAKYKTATAIKAGLKRMGY